MELFTILEVDLSDGEPNIVCTTDTPNVQKILDNYYGEYIEVSNIVPKDPKVLWSKVIEVKGMEEEPYRIRLTLNHQRLNEI